MLLPAYEQLASSVSERCPQPRSLLWKIFFGRSQTYRSAVLPEKNELYISYIELWFELLRRERSENDPKLALQSMYKRTQLC